MVVGGCNPVHGIWVELNGMQYTWQAKQDTKKHLNVQKIAKIGNKQKHFGMQLDLVVQEEGGIKGRRFACRQSVKEIVHSVKTISQWVLFFNSPVGKWLGPKSKNFCLRFHHIVQGPKDEIISGIAMPLFAPLKKCGLQGSCSSMTMLPNFLLAVEYLFIWEVKSV